MRLIRVNVLSKSPMLILFNVHKHYAGETLLSPSEVQRSGLTCPSHRVSEKGERKDGAQGHLPPKPLLPRTSLFFPQGKEDHD